MYLLLFFACTSKTPGSPVTETSEAPTPTPTWDAVADAVVCTPGGAAALLDTAFADADLDRSEFGYTDSEWDAWGSLVDTGWELSWYNAVHHEPEAVPCFAGQVQADVDVATASAHPVAAALAAVGSYADAAVVAEPVDPAGITFAEALSTLVDVAGDSDRDADEAAAELDPALAEALVPIILALSDAAAIRFEMDEEATEFSESFASELYNQGAGLVISRGSYLPDPGNADEYAWFIDWYHSTTGPLRLVDAARRVAFAVEDADLERFAGEMTSWTFETDAGSLTVSPGTDDTHEDEGPRLLHLDLGGNDTWRYPAGANTEKGNPIAVALDLGGDDDYGYEEVADAHDVSGVLASDEDGRQNEYGYYISNSKISRQGAGRYGIGMLFDWGGGADRYASLRMSQGFGAMGVGVLYDDAGDDTYAGEAGVQGSGVFGVGMLIDGGGTDSYGVWAYGQGFGYAGSVGVLADAGEWDDRYYSDPGNNFGGVTLYYSPQLPSGEGNSSFTQGAGFGLRGDAWGVYMGGGLGVLRDGGGDDVYTSGVFGIGTGYWEGTGLVADAGGNDSFSSLYYGQGGAAHYALGILVDGGGDDSHNAAFAPYYMMLGAGHDYSVGVLVDEGGDDTYVVPGLALGASNCQGRGVFVDNDGSDTYLVASTFSTGLGNHSTECEGRASSGTSNALFLDSGGDPDAWTWPADEVRLPADDSSFGLAWAGTADEHGGAVDGDGETGFHAAY